MEEGIGNVSTSLIGSRGFSEEVKGRVKGAL